MSVKVLLGKMTTWIRRLRKANAPHPPQCCWASSNPLMAWLQQKHGEEEFAHFSVSLCVSLSLLVSVSVSLCLPVSLSPWLSWDFHLLPSNWSSHISASGSGLRTWTRNYTISSPASQAFGLGTWTVLPVFPGLKLVYKLLGLLSLCKNPNTVLWQDNVLCLFLW